MAHLARSVERRDSMQSTQSITENIESANDELQVDSRRCMLSKVKQMDIGSIQLFGIKVENVKKSTKFLLDTFNFRFVRYDDRSGRTYLILYEAECDFYYFLKKPNQEKMRENHSLILRFLIYSYTNTYSDKLQPKRSRAIFNGS